MVLPPWEVSWLDAWLSPSVFQHEFKQLLVKQPLRRHLQCPGKCHDFEIGDLPDPSLDFRQRPPTDLPSIQFQACRQLRL